MLKLIESLAIKRRSNGIYNAKTMYLFKILNLFNFIDKKYFYSYLMFKRDLGEKLSDNDLKILKKFYKYYEINKIKSISEYVALCYFEKKIDFYVLNLERNINIRDMQIELFEEINQKKICIVGNSNSLVGKKYGSFIDSHDVVIRFNNFKLHKDHYGIKVSIVGTSPNLIEKKFTTSVTRFISAPHFIYRMNEYENIKYIGTPLWLWNYFVKILKSPPSIGILTLGLIVFTNYKPKSITTIGFNQSNDHVDAFNKICSRHNWRMEKKVFNKIINDYNIINII